MRHIFTIIIALLLFLPSCKTETKESYYNRGLAHQEKGQLDKAIEDYTKALVLNPDFASAYINRGIVYDMKHQSDKAIEDLTMAIALEPNNPVPYSNRGGIYNREGQHDKAIEDYTKAIAVDPNYIYAYSNRGNVYRIIGQYERAIEDFNKAIILDSNDTTLAYYSRGLTYYDKGQYDKAIRDFDKAIVINQNFALSYRDRGRSFALIGKLKEAEMDIKKALELSSTNLSIIVSMAEIYSIKNNTVEACEWLSKGIERGFNDWNYIKTSKTFKDIRGASCYNEIMSGR
ncbi:MAG: tetratricopeptide repeat protein [Nitrospirota bacterium]